jgi:hypothetical protein
VTVVGHQPEYLPYIGFFQKAARADRFILVDHVQFAKKDFQNRNYIRTKDGRLLLTVPVLSKSRFAQPIKDVEVNNSLPWARKHWQSLYLAYHRTPGFVLYGDELKAVYDVSWLRLADLTSTLISLMFKWFGLQIPIARSSELGITSGSTSLLVDLCRATGATTYISGTGGRDYVDLTQLKREGVRHYFCSLQHPVYPQIHGDFISNLSALDLLMNRGAAAKDDLQRCIEASPLLHA